MSSGSGLAGRDYPPASQFGSVPPNSQSPKPESSHSHSSKSRSPDLLREIDELIAFQDSVDLSVSKSHSDSKSGQKPSISPLSRDHDPLREVNGTSETRWHHRTRSPLEGSPGIAVPPGAIGHNSQSGQTGTRGDTFRSEHTSAALSPSYSDSQAVALPSLSADALGRDASSPTKSRSESVSSPIYDKLGDVVPAAHELMASVSLAAQSVSSAAQPVSSTAQPVASSIQSVASITQPVSLTTQSVASNVGTVEVLEQVSSPTTPGFIREVSEVVLA